MHSPSLFTSSLLVAGLLLGLERLAHAQTSPPPRPSAPQPEEEPAPAFTLGGYVEAYYQWSLARPDNGLTNVRGFDNRHNSLTLSNVALDAQYDRDALLGRVTLQVGSTPSTYYLAEPSSPGAGGANASNAETWKLIQQAYAGYRLANGLAIAAGVFLSPIGPESIAVRDNWSWSRSNLFFGLPFYHAGVRASYPLTERLTATVALYNGWNAIVDGNDEKSVSGQLQYTTPELTASALYFGGVERAPGAAEGRAWRHTFDGHATWRVTSQLSVQGHGSAGLEAGELGTSWWLAGALAARFQLCELWAIAARGDGFYEEVPQQGGATASPIFWPVPWVASGTLTAELRPHPRAALRLELRHDRADGDLFFGDDVSGDGGDAPVSPNRDTQTTATVGLTTWF